MSEKLSELARKGQKKRTARASAERGRLSAQNNKAARANDRRYRGRLLTSMLPLTHFTGVRVMLLIIGGPLLLVLLLVASGVLLPGPLWLAPALLATLVVGLFPYTRWRLRREVAWASTRPFSVVGYPEVLGGKSFTSVEVELCFCDAVPSSALLGDVVAAARWKTSGSSFNGNVATISVQFPAGSKFDEQRAWLRVWARDFIDTLLAELHAEYPIKSLSFPAPSRSK